MSIAGPTAPAWLTTVVVVTIQDATTFGRTVYLTTDEERRPRRPRAAGRPSHREIAGVRLRPVAGVLTRLHRGPCTSQRVQARGCRSAPPIPGSLPALADGGAC